MVEEGMSLIQISKGLFQLGHTNSLGKAFGTASLSRIVKILGLKLKNKRNTATVSDEQLEELCPIIRGMIEKSMTLNQISEELFEMGFTSNKKTKLSDSMIIGVLQRLGLKTKNAPIATNFSDIPEEELRPIIEPMIENVMSIRQISEKLSEMGYTTSSGNRISQTVLIKYLKKVGLKTKTRLDFYSEKLRPIIEPMVKEGMGLNAITFKLSDMGYTAIDGNTFSQTTVFEILKNINLKTKNNYNKPISSDKREELYPIIRPMIEEGLSVLAISNKLFELGYTNGVGNAFDHSTLTRIIKKLGLNTKNMATLQPA